MTETLTGKRRLRTHSNLFGKTWLVLQVEVFAKEPAYHTDHTGWVPKLAPPSSNYYWRDARISDLTVHDAGQMPATNKNRQAETRFRYAALGFSLVEMCVQRALVLQLQDDSLSEDYESPFQVWRDAGADDLDSDFVLTIVQN